MTPSEFKAARIEMGFRRQADLASALGLSGGAVYISRIEGGKVTPSETIMLLMQMYLKAHRHAPTLLPNYWPASQK